MNLNLDELSNDRKFQDLIKKLFEKMEYVVDPSGVGADEGKDILVSTTVDDKVAKHTNKWIVQCKYYKNSVSLADINDQNLPTLIYSYNATGYLLVVKNYVTSKLSKEFERLNSVDELKLGYKYVVWDGEDIINKIIKYEDLIQQFFPNYYAYLNTIKKI